MNDTSPCLTELTATVQCIQIEIEGTTSEDCSCFESPPATTLPLFVDMAFENAMAAGTDCDTIEEEVCSDFQTRSCCCSTEVLAYTGCIYANVKMVESEVLQTCNSLTCSLDAGDWRDELSGQKNTIFLGVGISIACFVLSVLYYCCCSIRRRRRNRNGPVEINVKCNTTENRTTTTQESTTIDNKYYESNSRQRESKRRIKDEESSSDSESIDWDAYNPSFHRHYQKEQSPKRLHVKYGNEDEDDEDSRKPRKKKEGKRKKKDDLRERRREIENWYEGEKKRSSKNPRKKITEDDYEEVKTSRREIHRIDEEVEVFTRKKSHRYDDEEEEETDPSPKRKHRNEEKRASNKRKDRNEERRTSKKRESRYEEAEESIRMARSALTTVAQKTTVTVVPALRQIVTLLEDEKRKLLERQKAVEEEKLRLMLDVDKSKEYAKELEGKWRKSEADLMKIQVNNELIKRTSSKNLLEMETRQKSDSAWIDLKAEQEELEKLMEDLRTTELATHRILSSKQAPEKAPISESTVETQGNSTISEDSIEESLGDFVEFIQALGETEEDYPGVQSEHERTSNPIPSDDGISKDHANPVIKEVPHVHAVAQGYYSEYHHPQAQPHAVMMQDGTVMYSVVAESSVPTYATPNNYLIGHPSTPNYAHSYMTAPESSRLDAKGYYTSSANDPHGLHEREVQTRKTRARRSSRQ